MSKLIVKMCFFARHLFVKLRNRPFVYFQHIFSRLGIEEQLVEQGSFLCPPRHGGKMSQKVNSLRGHGQGGLGLLVKQVLSRKTRGIGLIETLVGGAIGSIIIAGSMKSLQLSLESSQVAHASLSEAEFRHMINQFFTPNDNQKCLDNFAHLPTKPTGPDYDAIGLFGDNSEWGVGEVFKLDSSIPLVKGKTFKGALEIVKMELKGDLPATPPDSDKITKKEAPRHFIVYYKKSGMGSYSTVGGADCTATDLTGCYFNHCVLQLKLSSATSPEKKCESTCTAISGGGGGGGSGNPDCYKVDSDHTTAKTLVGCGGTDKRTAVGTTSFGYVAGQSITSAGSENTFLGAGAGMNTTSGKKNIFVGYMSGDQNRTGSDNIFIGKNAGYGDTNDNTEANPLGTGTNNIAIGSGVQVDSTTADNQINIGNIIKAEQEDKSDTDSTQIGVLKVCNADGSECLPLSKKSFTCPNKDGAKQFFRGFKDDGTPLCEKESCTPQTGIYFWKPENQCHHCPRASPLWKPNANPPSCGHCFANSRYVLANNRCRSTCPSYQTNNNGVCTCPPATPHHHGGRCNKCPQNQVLSNGYCCPSATPHYYKSYAQRIKKRCNRCPKSKPSKGSGGRCYPCLGGYYDPTKVRNCACNDSNLFFPPESWINPPQCIACEKELTPGLVTGVVGQDGECGLSCWPPYNKIRRIDNNKILCCPQSGPCCKSDHFLEGGKCKKRIEGVGTYSCSIGTYLSKEVDGYRVCCHLGKANLSRHCQGD